jgi:hypothetical protein
VKSSAARSISARRRRSRARSKALGIVRFDLKYSAGTLAHDKLMRCIELYGSKVIPLVRDMLA